MSNQPKIFLYGDAEARRNYTEALSAAGLMPVVTTDLSRAAGCAGLLLPGGGDLDPGLFGQENTASRNIDPALDQAELALVRQFAGKPVLGICRGMQLLNVAYGGDLIQDLPTAAAHRWEQADQTHCIRAEGFLRGLYGGEFRVNSAHHQGVGRLAEGFCVTARADDGVAEAMECPQRRVYAVQWHPERMMLAHARTDTVDGGAVFRFFAELVAGNG